jgi:valyl-tRNA synthetase
VFVLLKDVLDFDSESKRLEKELAKLEKEFGYTQKKLSNEDFLGRAPADVIEKEREKGTRLRVKLEKLRHQYEKMKTLRDSVAAKE